MWFGGRSGGGLQCSLKASCKMEPDCDTLSESVWPEPGPRTGARSPGIRLGSPRCQRAAKTAASSAKRLQPPQLRDQCLPS